MTEIKEINNQTIIDYMARDYDSLLRSMREGIPEKLPEWREYKSEADFGNVLLQLFAYMGDILSYYQDRVANESFPGTARSRRSVIQHLRLIGYSLATAAPASADLQITVPKECVETVTIAKGDAFATKSQKDQASVRFEYTREYPLTIPWKDIPSRDNKCKIFGNVPVEEGRLVKEEILGTSGGEPNQRYILVNPRLILRPLGQCQESKKDLILISELNGMLEEWRLLETLAFSGKNDRDFMIEIDEEDRAAILFGDGAFGAFPTKGAVLKATYRVGGGKQGNCPAESIVTITDAPQLILLGAKVTNPQAAVGGADRETIEHAVQHAPQVFRSLKRAVTADDYKTLALAFKGVGKVRAEAPGWNTVNLFVAPEGGGSVSDVLKENLLAYFEDKRPIATVIEIKDVDYVKIFLTVEIAVKSYYAEEEVKEQVVQAVRGLLDFKNVDFGLTLYLSRFYDLFAHLNGIDYTAITEFRRQEQPKMTIAEHGRIELGVNEIPEIPDDQTDPDYASGVQVLIVKGNH